MGLVGGKGINERGKYCLRYFSFETIVYYCELCSHQLLTRFSEPGGYPCLEGSCDLFSI